MKKSLLALAVTAGIAASGAASAEVKTYGHAQVEIGIHGGDNDTGMSVQDAARGRIGIKTSEDLGGGLKALVKAEFKTDFADGDSDKADNNKGAEKAGIALTKREMLVGLKGSFGQVEMGRIKSAYKYYGGAKYDPFIATLLEARGRSGMTGKVGDGNAYGHNSFISDSVGYQNKMGAISFRVTYDFDNGGPTADNKANGMTAGFKFKTKKFEVVAAIANDGNDAAKTSLTKVGGQFKVSKALKISAQLETGEVAAADQDNLWVNADFGLGGGTSVNAAFGTQTAGTTDSTMLRAAFTKKFSKQTKVWVGYSAEDVDGGSADNVIALGMQKRF